MPHTNKAIALCASFTLVLSACTQPPGNIREDFDLNAGSSLTTGSRQRAITNVDIGRFSLPGQVDPSRIVCAEPSPDVAVAVANSFGAGLSVLDFGSGSLTAAQAEGIAQLAERTVTVQLLRDQMYRACEAYSNGAISDTTYSLVMSRINDTMVTLLLGETAGGAFGRQLAAIGTGADARAQASLGAITENVEELRQAADELQAANQAVEAQQQVVNDKRTIANGENPPDGADDDVTDAEAELRRLEQDRDRIADSLQADSRSLSESAAAVNRLTAGGQINASTDEDVANALSEMQQQFLRDDNAHSLISACVVELAGQSNFVTEIGEVRIEGAYAQRLQTNLDQLSVRYLVNPENQAIANEIRYAERALFNYISYFNGSKLGQMCEGDLLKFVQEIQKLQIEQERTVRLEELPVRLAQTDLQMATEINELMEQCRAVTDEQQKQWCNAAFAALE